MNAAPSLLELKSVAFNFDAVIIFSFDRVCWGAEKWVTIKKKRVAIDISLPDDQGT